MLLEALLTLPTRSGTHLAARLTGHLHTTLEHLAGLRAGIDETFRAAGHGVSRLDGVALGCALAKALAPLAQEAPVIVPDLPLQEQVLGTDASRLPGGWTFGTDAPLTAQVLSLHRAPPRTYPGMLSAPRAPQGAQPLALWDAWPGPLSLVVNVAVVDQAVEKARLRQKRALAYLQRFNPLGDASPEHVALKEELDLLLRQFFLTGGQLLWGGPCRGLGPGERPGAGVEDVVRAGRRGSGNSSRNRRREYPVPPTLLWVLIPPGRKETYLRRAQRLPEAEQSGTTPPPLWRLSRHPHRQHPRLNRRGSGGV